MFLLNYWNHLLVSISNPHTAVGLCELCGGNMQFEKLMRKLTRMSRVKGKMLENEEWEDVEEKEWNDQNEDDIDVEQREADELNVES